MFRAPTQAGLPQLHTMLSDIPYGNDKLARHLGISTSTMNQYERDGQAPRPIMLALFWETRWGRSAADVEAANAASRYYAWATSLERQNAALKKHIEMLEQELASAPSHRAANAPIWMC